MKKLFKGIINTNKVKTENSIKYSTIDKLDNETYNGGINIKFIYQNDNINLTHDAACICYGSNIDKPIEDKEKFLSARVKQGHESIIEHSNVIIQYRCKTTIENLKDLNEIRDAFRYVTTKTVNTKTHTYLIVAGSIRGFKNIIRNVSNADNKFYRAILKSLYYLNPCYFKDFIEDNLMTLTNFIPTQFYAKQDKMKIETPETELVRFDNIDSLELIKSRLDVKLPLNDLIDLGTVTILFKSVPRVISQQITRHRNAITQLSQRYTDSSNAKFIKPILSKPLKDKFDITLNSQYTTQESLQSLGDMIASIYPQLLEQGLLKQEARAYLPLNIDSSLFVTFTYSNLLHFLKLRTEKAAQADVRIIANDIETIFKTNFIHFDYALILPKYKIKGQMIQEELDIDEIIE